MLVLSEAPVLVFCNSRLCVCDACSVQVIVCGVQLYRSLYKVCRLCVCDACSVQVMCVCCMWRAVIQIAVQGVQVMCVCCMWHAVIQITV